MANVHLNEARLQQLTELCQDLIRTPGLAGQEGAVADRVTEWMHRLGYHEVRRDTCGNVIGCFRTGRPDAQRVLFDGHMDTVRTGDGWTYDPLGATLDQGRIWGRGSTDTKGSLAAAMCAVAYAWEDGARDNDLYVVASCGEEYWEGVAMAGALAEIKPHRVVVCEPTSLNLVTGGRGRAELTVEVFGRSAHSARPTEGISALKHATHVIQALDAMPIPTHPVLGPGLLEPTDCITEPYPSISVIPSRARVRYDRRLLPGETSEGVLAEIQAVLDGVAERVAELRAEVSVCEGEFHCYTGHIIQGPKFLPAWALADNHPYVVGGLAALRSVGIDPQTKVYPGCCNANQSAGISQIPTVVFGPGDHNQCHVIDESISVERLAAGCAGYQALAMLAITEG